MSANKLQPSVLTGIDPYWLSRGLSYVYMGNKLIWSRDSMVKLPLTIVGTPKTVPSPVGIATGFGTTYGTGATDSLTGPILTTGSDKKGRSVVAHVYKNGAGGGGFGRMFEAGAGAAGAEFYYTGATDFLTYQCYGQSPATFVSWTGTHTVPAGRASVQGMSLELAVTGKQAYWYSDGRFTGASNPSSTPAAYGVYRNTVVVGNRTSDNGRNWDGWIGSILIFDGVPLTAAEHASLAANPHQVWAQVRSTIWPVAAVATAQPERKTIKVTRTKQPVGFVELDRRNPLARGAHAWSAHMPAMWSGGGMRPKTGELNAVVGASKNGVTRGWTAVANAGVAFGVQNVITQSSGIAALVVGAPAAGTSRFIASQRLTATPTVAMEILYNDNGQGTASSGSIALRAYAAGYKAVSATSQVDGTQHTWVLSNSTDAGFILRDGQEQTLASNTRLSGTAWETGQSVRVGNIADNATSGFQCSEGVSLVVVWNRALTIAEAQAITKNPWQIFEPEQRVLWAVGAANPDVTVALSGVLGTLSVGTFLPELAAPITGVAGTLSAGTMLPVTSAALSGVLGTVSVGSVLASTSVALAGVESTISIGTLTAVSGTIVALTGVSATLSLGSVLPQAAVPITGVSGTISAGTLGPLTSLAATGVSGTLSVGTLLPASSIPLTGVEITTSIGTMVVSGGTVTVALTGVSATVSLGSLTALAVDGWTQIPTPQTPGWVAISNTQTPLWTPIIDTQTPGWTPVIT